MPLSHRLNSFKYTVFIFMLLLSMKKVTNSHVAFSEFSNLICKFNIKSFIKNEIN